MTKAEPESIVTRPVVTLLAAGILYFIVAGVSFPVLPRLIERELHGGDVEIGLAFGVFAVGMLTARPFVGFLSDRFGRRPMMVLGAIGVALTQFLIVPAAGLGFVAFLGVRFLTGVASSAMYLGQATTATELEPQARSGEIFSTFSVAVFVGFAIGPVLGESVLEASGFSAAFVVAGFVGLGCAALGATLPETRPVGVRPRLAGASDLFHPVAARAGMVSFLVFVAFISFNAFVTPYAESLGLERARWILLAYSLTTMVMRAVGGRLIDQVNRLVLGTVANTVVAIGLAIIVIFNAPWALYVGGVVMASGLAFNVPLMIVIAADSATPAERSRVVATVVMFGDMANSAGAFALGFVASGLGYRGMYTMVACSALGAVVLLNSRFMDPVIGLKKRRVAVA